jgi:hypothetical protein
MVKLVKDNFVAVSVSNFDQGRRDAVGQFIRDSGMKLPGAGGSIWYVTPSGKLLGGDTHASGTYSDPRKAIREWQKLPEAERKPGAVQVGEVGEVDLLRAGPKPPAGAMILKLHYRAFMRDADGKLRHLTSKDLWHASGKNEAAFETQYPGSITTPQSQVDHMWLTEAEWKSLMPEAPRQGDKYPLPAAIKDRMVRWHLNPHVVYGEANALDRKSVRASELTMTVVEVSPTTVRLRLDGFAKLGTEAPESAKTGKPCFNQWGYEPRLLGLLEYDVAKKRFTRFDIIAMGDHFGKLGHDDSAARPGLQPLGVTFELGNGDLPADRVPPGRTPSASKYFEPGQ